MNKVSADMVRVMADPPFAQRLASLGAEPQAGTPAALTAHMRRDAERWGRVIKGIQAAGVKIGS